MVVEQLVEPKRELIAARRAALENGDEEEYKKLVKSGQ